MLVGSRRGGHCFERNRLFRAAIDALDFATTALGRRVRRMSPPEPPLGTRMHMVILVDLPEGQRLVSVGFGERLVHQPLSLQTGTEQRSAMGPFRLDEGNGLLWLKALRRAAAAARRGMVPETSGRPVAYGYHA